MKTVVSNEVIADAVHLACRAPSYHNSQPWRFVAEGAGVLHLYLDRDRLVESDSSGRQALISCGAVLDRLRVSMAAAGWAANVHYYPNPNDYTHLAAIDFVPMSFVTPAHRRRADAILAGAPTACPSRHLPVGTTSSSCCGPRSMTISRCWTYCPTTPAHSWPRCHS